MFAHVSGSLSSLPASAMSSSTCTCTFAYSAQSARRRTSSFRNLTFLFRDPILPYFKKLLEAIGGVRELANLKIFQDTHRGLRGFTHQILRDSFEHRRIVCGHRSQDSLCPLYASASYFSKCSFFLLFLHMQFFNVFPIPPERLAFPLQNLPSLLLLLHWRRRQMTCCSS